MASTAHHNKVNVKVVMLGKEFGGKTSLVERFLTAKFNPLAYKNTIAAEYRAKRVEVDGRFVVVGLWDTAGSERYQSLSRIYYRDAFAAVVCYDLTDGESWEKVKFWVNELVQYQPTCRIYFCGTKQDLVEKGGLKCRQVCAASVADFADSLQPTPPNRPRMYETSSKSGYNVEEMFVQVAREYLEDPTVDPTVEDRKSIKLNAEKKDGKRPVCASVC